MPDIVKTKKFKENVVWIGYNNPEMHTMADILMIKLPENESTRIGGKASAKELGGSFDYEKQQTGNQWEAFVFAPTYSMLPLDTWKKIAAQGTSVATGNQIAPSSVSTFGVSGFLGNMPTFECPNCNIRLVVQEQPNFCPSCGYKLEGVPKSNTQTEKAGVP